MPTTLVTRWAGTPSLDDLHQDERAIAACLPKWRQLEFIRGRLTARAALALVSGRRPRPVLRAENGAPTVDGWSISLAHSGMLAACAVEKPGLPIGVDIETIDERNRILLPQVTGSRDVLPAPVDPTLVFSCKEAAYKACGAAAAGLVGYPVRITATRIDIIPPAAAGLSRLRAYTHRLPGTHLVTVAAPDRPVDWHFTTWHFTNWSRP